jgi:hypothetical protein
MDTDKDELTSYRDGVEFFKSRAEHQVKSIWEEYPGLLSKVFSEQGTIDDVLDKIDEHFSKLIKEACEKGKTDREISKLVTDATKVAYSVRIQSILLQLKEPDSDINRDAYLMYILGFCRGISAASDPATEPHKLLRGVMKSLNNSEIVNKRWLPKKRAEERANEIADGLWTHGEDCLHNEMAEYLFSHYGRSQLNGLTRDQILRAIRPAAKKHNRCLGIKGVKKEID